VHLYSFELGMTYSEAIIGSFELADGYNVPWYS
jgi:hypothetical protein